MTTSVQTDALLAKFAVLAYKNQVFLNNTQNLPAGWRLADFQEAGPFVGVAFQNADGKVVIAYRGTDGVSDASADAAILRGKWDSQFDQGISFAAKVRRNPDIFPSGPDDSKILVTGHSLGGAIAQVVSQGYGFDGSTIDPGAGARITQRPEFQVANTPRSGLVLQHLNSPMHLLTS